MTVAFSDVNLVCDMLRPLPSFANFVDTNSATADFYVARKPLSATINTLANALYKVGGRCACCCGALGSCLGWYSCWVLRPPGGDGDGMLGTDMLAPAALP